MRYLGIFHTELQICCWIFEVYEFCKKLQRNKLQELCTLFERENDYLYFLIIFQLLPIFSLTLTNVILGGQGQNEK